jgi:GNAT superfamily N-acetyltransferase
MALLLMLRLARAEDLPDVLAIHAKGFVAAHQENGAIDTDYLTQKRVASGAVFRREWEEALLPPKPPELGAENSNSGNSNRATVVLADAENGRILGFAAVERAGKHSRRHVPRAETQLRKLYLSADAPRRRGLGTLLLRSALLAAKGVAQDGGQGPVTDAELAALCEEHVSQQRGETAERSDAVVDVGDLGTKEEESSVESEPVGLAVWCLARNEAACAFYEASGMARVEGASVARFGGKRYPYAGYHFSDVVAAYQTLAGR